MGPIWQLLKSRQNDENWNPSLRGGLRSVLANRQYPQVRAFAAGWATHNKCFFCFHQLADLGARTVRRTSSKGKTRQNDQAKQDKIRYKVEATAEQIAEAPVGNLGHRIWKCQAEYMVKLRERWAAPADLATTMQCDTEGHPA